VTSTDADDAGDIERLVPKVFRRDLSHAGQADGADDRDDRQQRGWHGPRRRICRSEMGDHRSCTDERESGRGDDTQPWTGSSPACDPRSIRLSESFEATESLPLPKKATPTHRRQGSILVI